MTPASSGKLEKRSQPSARRRISVLHVNSGNMYGGVESILTALAALRGLCPSLEPQFALCQEGRSSRELRGAGAPVHMLGAVRISRPWTVWRARRRLREILESQRFEMVICHMPWSLAVFGPVVHSARVRLGFWAHGLHTGRHWLESWARRASPDVAIANSQYTQSGVKDLFPDVPCQIIYPPLEFPAISGSAERRSSVRSALGVSEETVVIVQVSRLEAWKGHALHVDALARLGDIRAPWVCWMVGGAQRPEEEAYLRGLQAKVRAAGLTDRIQFLGQRQDVAELLGAADLFCQPNQGPEPFGIVFVEALRAGLPVVATALGGAREIIDDSCGSLTPAGDGAALSAALRSLIEDRDLRARLGGGGPARAARLCDPAQQMRLLDELCRPGEDRAGQP